jgi:hypothetical protein
MTTWKYSIHFLTYITLDLNNSTKVESLSSKYDFAVTHPPLKWTGNNIKRINLNKLVTRKIRSRFSVF